MPACPRRVRKQIPEENCPGVQSTYGEPRACLLLTELRQGLQQFTTSPGLWLKLIQQHGAGLSFYISNKLPAVHLWTRPCIPSLEGLMSLIWGKAWDRGFFKAASGIQICN